MIVSQCFRLWLYIAMAVLPVWIDWAKLSVDLTFRGLLMPILVSINTAVIVALAKTSPPPDTAKTTTKETQTPDGATEKVVETETARAQAVKP